MFTVDVVEINFIIIIIIYCFFSDWNASVSYINLFISNGWPDTPGIT